MPEQYRTVCIDQFFSSTTYAFQHFTVCSNKSSLPDFLKGPSIVSLYDSTASGTYKFKFHRQFIIVRTSPKEKDI